MASVDGLHLPQHLMINILSRLPVKNLCRLKCASKAYRDLIADPYFKKVHRDFWSKQSPRLLIFDTPKWGPEYSAALEKESSVKLSCIGMDDGVTVQEFTTPLMQGVLEIMPCSSLCRDLICLTNYDYAYICNPSSQEFIQLPPLPNATAYRQLSFGYISSTREFVVIHFYSQEGPLDQKCEILTFSMGGDQSWMWREVKDELHKNPISYGFQANGELLYWLLDEIIESDKFILTFDIKTEKFGAISHPQGFKVDLAEENYGLGEVRGNLCLLDAHLSKTLDVWMLNDYANEAWENLCSIQVRDPITRMPALVQEEQGELMVYDIGRFMIYYYNLAEKRLRTCDFVKITENANLWLYNESLITFSREENASADAGRTGTSTSSMEFESY